MSNGFYKRRRGIIEDIEDGTIDLLESGIHDYLNLKANLVIGNGYKLPAGVVSTSAPAIHAYCEYVSERTIRRILNHLEEIGWIKRWQTNGKRGNYMVLIGRATVHDLSGNEYRVNAEATTDWRNPVYEPVRDLSADSPRSVHELSGLRELRSESREKRGKKETSRPAPKTGATDQTASGFELTALQPKPAGDHRHSQFVKIAVEAFKGKYGSEPTWAKKDYAMLADKLANNPHLTVDDLQGRWLNFLASTHHWHEEKGGSLAHFCLNLDSFIQGPLEDHQTKTFAQIGRDTTDAAARNILDRFHAQAGPRSFDQIRRDEGDAAARRILERVKEPRTFDQIRRDETDGAISRVLERAGIDPATGKRREIPIAAIEED